MDASTFHLSVTSKEAAQLLGGTKSIRVLDLVLDVSSVSRQIVSVNVNWLPSSIRDAFLDDFFAGFGKVLKVTREAGIITPNATLGLLT